MIWASNLAGRGRERRQHSRNVDAQSLLAKQKRLGATAACSSGHSSVRSGAAQQAFTAPRFVISLLNGKDNRVASKQASWTARGFVVQSDEAPGFWQLGNLWRVMATGVQTGNSFCLIDQLVMADGGGPCTHAHTQDEGLYVISGHCTFNAWGLTVPAGPGEFVAVPRYGQHAFTVDAPDTQLLNFYLPAGFELLLMGLAHPAERNELPPEGAVPMAPRHLVERLSSDYGQIPILGLPFADPPRPDSMATEPTPHATVRAFHANAKTAPAYWFAGALWTMLADGAATDGSYCLFEELVPHGPAAPAHLHRDMDEVFYVLEGEAEFLISDKRRVARKGALVFVPRATVHGFQVISEEARLLNLYTPAGFDRLVTTMGQRTEARTLPPAGWAPPTFPQDRREELFIECGMVPLAVVDPFSHPQGQA